MQLAEVQAGIVGCSWSASEAIPPQTKASFAKGVSQNVQESVDQHLEVHDWIPSRDFVLLLHSLLPKDVGRALEGRRQQNASFGVPELKRSTP